MKPKLGWTSEREFNLWLQGVNEREARSVTHYPYGRHQLRKVPVPANKLRIMFILTLVGGACILTALYWILS